MASIPTTLLSEKLSGTTGDDTFNDVDALRGGEDTMTGLGGNDTYYVDSAKDIVVEAKLAGTDTVNSFISYKLTANVENLNLIGLGNINGTGNELDNIIIGNAKDNILDGGKGNDTLTGGAGDDIYVIDNIADITTENANEGIDTLKSSVLLPGVRTNIENYTYTGKLAWVFAGDNGNNRITGGTGNDQLSGFDGNDWLDGGKGIDQLTGGNGNDTYVIDNKDDKVVGETAQSDPHDLVRATILIDLTAKNKLGSPLYTGVEDVTLTGKASLNAFGRDLEANILIGNDGSNILDGRGGNDALYGGKGKDTLIAGTGNDFLDGGEGNDLVSLTGYREDYTLRLNLDGSQLIRDDNALDGDTGTDRLLNIESLIFADKKSIAMPSPIIDSDGATTNLVVAQSAQAGMSVGLTAQAQFPGDLPAIYSLADDANGRFQIDSVTGEVTVKDASLIGFGATNGQYVVVVRATSEQRPALEREFAIDLQGIDIGITQSTFDLYENNAATTIGFAITDPSATLSLSGPNAGLFTITQSPHYQGFISINPNMNFESASLPDADNDLSNGKQIVLTILASNGIDPDATKDLTITIADEVEVTGSSLATIFGGPGADIIVSTSSPPKNTTFAGLEGDDTLLDSGNVTSDSFNGGLGSDTASYQNYAGGNVTIDLATGSTAGGAAGDTYASTENLIGTSSGDKLTGNGADNVLEGGSGDDILDGRGNNIRGDTVSYAGSAIAVTVSLAIAGQQNTIGAGKDTLSNFENILGSGFADNLTGDANDNILIGGLGADQLDGGGGNDTASYEMAASGVTADLASPASNQGEATGDIYANIENLSGSIFGDHLIGDANDNILMGGGGIDTLTGGGGADTFKYQFHSGALLITAHADIVTDFDVLQGDKLDLADLNLGPTNIAALVASGTLNFSGNDVEIDLNGGSDNFVRVFTLTGILANTLTDANFIF